MNLIKVHFDAYKSLLEETLELQNSCIGFVGFNEAGKSNILSAINTLSPQHILKASDTPRMKPTINPYIRFEFLPNDEERGEFVNLIQETTGLTAAASAKILTSDFTVTYHVLFDRQEQQERRFFSVTGFCLPNKRLVLRHDAATEGYSIRRGETFVPLREAIFMTEGEITSNEKIHQASNRLVSIDEEVAELENQIEERIEKEPPTSEAEPTAQDDGAAAETKPENAGASVDPETQKKQHRIATLQKDRAKLQTQVKGFNLYQRIAHANKRITEFDEVIQESANEIEAIESKPEVPEQPDDTRAKELQKLSKRKDKALAQKVQEQNLINSLEEPLRGKFTDNVQEVAKHLSSIETSLFQSHLPRVVFWQPNDDYILQGKTALKDLIDAKTLDGISRPLANLFMIGLGTKTLKDIKAKIYEIQRDSSEMTRAQEKLNKLVNRYLNTVWPDYDQEIKITLEQERIRVQFFDPSCDENASFFNMGERSQGCQTFISFLLILAAETKEGVMRNTVLLLDEPETHLHPTGVRFMLQELIKAAKNDNTVLFATHSIFMIDRDNFNRHIILTKEKEQTRIQPSQRERIGFFMQEEVLYLALDIDLSKDFSSTGTYNFVFEGNGDAILFEYIYANLLPKKERPFDDGMIATGFYPGGGCKNIQKYFTRKPIQLGTTWVFILDSDEPANELRSFIEAKYHDFLNNCIYVVQYEKGERKESVQLEDLLPKEFLSEALLKAVAECDATDSIKLEPVPGTAFAESFETLVEQFDDENEFKKVFKRTLNGQLSSILKETDKKDIKETFPEYCSWVSSVMKEIKEIQSTPSSAPASKSTTDG